MPHTMAPTGERASKPAQIHRARGFISEMPWKMPATPSKKQNAREYKRCIHEGRGGSETKPLTGWLTGE